MEYVAGIGDIERTVENFRSPGFRISKGSEQGRKKDEDRRGLFKLSLALSFSFSQNFQSGGRIHAFLSK